MDEQPGDADASQPTSPGNNTAGNFLSVRGATEARDVDECTVHRAGARGDGRTLVEPSLPRPATALVGREREAIAVRDLLRDPSVRLVTLIGPGGVGKTRLAVVAAAHAAEAFVDGVAYVELAAIRDPALLLATVADQLGARPTADGPADRLRPHLQDRRLLLVLDNFEQVVDAAGGVVGLLSAHPNLTVLATSRTLLRVSGERAFPVPPLDVPHAQRVGVAGARASGAVRLFAARAEAVDPTFAITEANADAVAGICRRLDGLPLAIELAAARIRHLPPQALLARLERRLPLLTGGPRDAPERQRTLRATIAWSHDLLSLEERALFARLAVFAGSFSLEGAEAVCSVEDDPGEGVFAGVAALTDASLLHREDAGGAPRYGMLETVREFGLEQLATGDHEDQVRARHATWCLDLADRLATNLDGADASQRLQTLVAEHANLRAALTWLLASGGGDEALKLAGALVWYWHSVGALSEGRSWLERALALDPVAAAASRERALFAAGVLAHAQGDDVHAAASLEQSLGLARAGDDAPGIASAIARLGILAEDTGDYDRAHQLLEEALVHFRELDDQSAVARVLNHLGVVAWGRSDEQRATTLWEEALALQYGRGDTVGAAISLHWLGLLAGERGDRAQAARRHSEGLARRWEVGAVEGVPFALADIAALAVASGRPEPAAHLFGAAEAARETIGRTLDQPERGLYERAATAARMALGEDSFAAAWAVGRSLPLPEAVAEAKATVHQIADEDWLEARSQPAPDRLTPRERQVLRLLAEGQTDKEIGEALFISHRTVMGHVANLLAKLGVSSRTAVAHVAARRGLL